MSRGAANLGVLLHNDRAQAGLGGDGGGGEAAYAGADDHDVSLDVPALGRLDGHDRHGVGADVARGHGHGVAAVGLGALAPAGNDGEPADLRALGRRGGLVGRSLVGMGDACRSACGGDGAGGKRRPLDERTT